MTEPSLRDLLGKLSELAPARPPASQAEIDSSERRLGIRLSADFACAYATLNGTIEPTPVENGWIELWPLMRWFTVEEYVRDWPEPERKGFAALSSAIVFADYSIESWHYAAHFSATSVQPAASIYLLHLQPHLVADSLQGFLAAALVDDPAIYPPTTA
jgi:SMI1 / KNR4 family (SUKH-1)